jgi:DNA modification methylase
MSVKPEPMLRHFFEMVVDSNTSMLDPTAGSGSALRAADSLKARRVVGIERDAEFAERANDAWIKAKKMRSAA